MMFIIICVYIVGAGDVIGHADYSEAGNDASLITISIRGAMPRHHKKPETS